MKVKPGSIEHRKAIAKKYNFIEQEIIDLPEKMFEMLCTGLTEGENYAAKKLMRYIEEQEKKEKEKEDHAETNNI